MRMSILTILTQSRKWHVSAISIRLSIPIKCHALGYPAVTDFSNKLRCERAHYEDGEAMSIFPRCSARLAVVVALCAIACTSALATQPVHPVANPCQRFAAGSVVNQSSAVFSQNGVLNVRFSYQQTTDAQGRLLHCLMTDTGLEEQHTSTGAGGNVQRTQLW